MLSNQTRDVAGYVGLGVHSAVPASVVLIWPLRTRREAAKTIQPGLVTGEPDSRQNHDSKLLNQDTLGPGELLGRG